MTWEMVKFNDIVQDITGGNKKFQSSEYLPYGIYPIIDQGDSLIGGYSNINVIVRRAKDVVVFGDHTKSLKFVDFDFCLGADGVKVLQPFAGLDSKFLYYYLGTISLPNVGYSRHYKFLKEISIPLPPLPEQRRIANILDHADSIRRKNRQILEKYNELAQSVFYEMFGDPVKNEKEWEKYKLSKIIKKLDTGKSFASVEDLNSGDYKVLKTSSVSWGSFKKNEYKSLPTKYIPPHNHLIKKGDILMSRMNTTELVGASTYVFEEVKGLALPDRIWKFVFNELIPTDSIFIWYSINTKSFRSEISKISSGTSGSMKNISKEKVLNLSTIIPPIKFQKKFAEIIENIELQKRLSQNSLDKCEILFQSLLQKAFKGEL